MTDRAKRIVIPDRQHSLTGVRRPVCFADPLCRSDPRLLAAVPPSDVAPCARPAARCDPRPRGAHRGERVALPRSQCSPALRQLSPRARPCGLVAASRGQACCFACWCGPSFPARRRSCSASTARSSGVGARIAAKGIYHDAVRSSCSFFVKASGRRWPAMMLLAEVPFAQRVWTLPAFTALSPSERHHRERPAPRAPDRGGASVPAAAHPVLARRQSADCRGRQRLRRARAADGIARSDDRDYAPAPRCATLCPTATAVPGASRPASRQGRATAVTELAPTGSAHALAPYQAMARVRASSRSARARHCGITPASHRCPSAPPRGTPSLARCSPMRWRWCGHTCGGTRIYAPRTRTHT